MKKILIILITIPLIFNSCKKEDDSPNSGSNNTSGSIIGTWKVENYTNTMSEGYIDPVLGTEVVTNTEVSTGSVDVEEYQTFTNDNTSLNYQYENDTLISELEFNYIKNGNEITIYNVGNFDIILTITELTNTNFSYNISHGGQWTEGNTTYFQTTTGSGNFSKSNLPLITITPLNKNKPVSGYNSFLNKRENR